MHKFPITWQEVLAIFGFAGLAHTLVTKLGAGNFLQVLIPVGILVAGCIVRAQCNLWAASEFRFKPVKFKKGTGTLDCILKAEDSIFVTHFVGDVPNDLRRLHVTVRVVRTYMPTHQYSTHGYARRIALRRHSTPPKSPTGPKGLGSS